MVLVALIETQNVMYSQICLHYGRWCSQFHVFGLGEQSGKLEFSYQQGVSAIFVMISLWQTTVRR